jgi:peptide/nickel transport system substrate-binding protein
LNKLEVRQAISCAIDRQEVLDTASLGEGQVTGPLTIPAYQLSPGEYFCYKKDVEFSKKLLKNAGWSSGVKLKAIVASAEPPTSLSEAQNIQAQLAKVGIEMEIESLELSVYIQRWLKADFDMAVAHNSGRADPYTMYNRYWTKKGNLQKVSKYIDDKLDRLMAEGRVETEPKRRKRIFADFQKHLVKQAPWIWLYTGFEYTAQQSYVTGFVPMSNDSLYFLHQVRLSK